MLQKRSITVEMGGKKYEATELTLQDFELLKEYPATRKVENFMKSIQGKNIPPTVIAETISRLYEAVEEQAEQEKYMGSIAGMRMFIWLSLRHKHPTLKFEEVDFPLSELEQVTMAITAVSQTDETEEKAESKPKLPGEVESRPT